jgi:hypothetical protein
MAPAIAATSPSLSFTLANSCRLGAGMLRSRLLYLQHVGSRRQARRQVKPSQGRPRKWACCSACQPTQQVACQIWWSNPAGQATAAAAEHGCPQHLESACRERGPSYLTTASATAVSVLHCTWQQPFAASAAAAVPAAANQDVVRLEQLTGERLQPLRILHRAAAGPRQCNVHDGRHI